MASERRTFRLGARFDAQTDRLANELGLSRADVVRTALAALDANEDMKDALQAVAAAQRFLAALGDCNILLTEDRTLAATPLRIVTREGEREVEGAQVYATRRRGSVHFDLYLPEADVTIEDVGVVSVPGAADELASAGLPSRALVLDSPTPPIEPDLERDTADGREVVLWGNDGARHTFSYDLDPAGPTPANPRRHVHRGRPT